MCWTLEDKATGNMKDKELEAMLKDFVKVLHDCEWYDSDDIGEDAYFETVRKFKKKWFGKRDERLQEIIETSIEELKQELTRMIKVDN